MLQKGRLAAADDVQVTGYIFLLTSPCVFLGQVRVNVIIEECLAVDVKQILCSDFGNDMLEHKVNNKWMNGTLHHQINRSKEEQRKLIGVT